MQRVAGQTPEQLEALISSELRVITENPYEYEEDDEANFKVWPRASIHPSSRTSNHAMIQPSIMHAWMKGWNCPFI
eukprot:269097-Chlamydomonas_euryale.AAC.1